MGSSCKSIKNVKESNDFDSPEQEGAIRTVGDEPIPKKPYCCLSNELTEQSDNLGELEVKEHTGIPENQIFQNSVVYSREIVRSEQFQQNRKHRPKKRLNKVGQNTETLYEKQLYKQLRMNILSPEIIIRKVH
ncbi:unnamed protein product (macronuclear) [Paramecium tetraurelia]|uniref:Uncharacterized protein n=1 Tax=Paramecium tetraurelia TaxID=5888 RepID=A0D091_PARTE|nr:uncharacterized protein GSPATT00012010001 [Paramecium tetraurelia]CAK76458.1 unnamed protein product [Paramecium tetraurelia]|eukprot:XP_001443855.1 hypothetical protein (macronuclear) [Paramecium tetraurelia strain d4-2]